MEVQLKGQPNRDWRPPKGYSHTPRDHGGGGGGRVGDTVWMMGRVKLVPPLRKHRGGSFGLSFVTKGVFAQGWGRVSLEWEISDQVECWIEWVGPNPGSHRLHRPHGSACGSGATGGRAARPDPARHPAQRGRSPGWVRQTVASPHHRRQTGFCEAGASFGSDFFIGRYFKPPLSTGPLLFCGGFGSGGFF